MPIYRIYFSGAVQGVGFRAAGRRLARRLPALAGQVGNLADGRVQLTVRGAAGDVARLIDALRAEFPDHIDDVEQHELPPGDDPLPAGASGVEIVYGL